MALIDARIHKALIDARIHKVLIDARIHKAISVRWTLFPGSPVLRSKSCNASPQWIHLLSLQHNKVTVFQLTPKTPCLSPPRENVCARVTFKTFSLRAHCICAGSGEAAHILLRCPAIQHVQRVGLGISHQPACSFISSSFFKNPAFFSETLAWEKELRNKKRFQQNTASQYRE